MAKTALEILFEKLGDRIRKAKEAHKNEWYTLSRNCPYREKGNNFKLFGIYNCKKLESSFFCVFENCPLVKKG
jgi:hypothetical protein